MHAWNSCGSVSTALLCPTMTRRVKAFDLTDISTLAPFTLGISAKQTRIHTQRTHSTYTQTHQYPDDRGYCCGPRLAIPARIRDFGYPWWSKCEIQNSELGMVDPPYAITPVTGLEPLTPLGPAPAPAISSLAETTSGPASGTLHATKGQAKAIPTIPIATIGTQVISAATGNGGSNTPIIILPEGSSLEPGSTATIPVNDGSGKSVEVVLHGGSLNSPGNVVISIINAVGPNIYTIPLPAIMHPTTAPPELLGVTIYMDKTLKLGEAVATISSNGAVITYGSSGVVVQYPGGAVSTVPLVIGKSGMCCIWGWRRN
ncbi:hypothetical protein B0J14DRAFT_652907 [Halenospora varia]|nr:hypothetical protein B0J14DRAFT_652907 [Halenospora varia]